MTSRKRTKGEFDVSKEQLAITQALITLSTLTVEKKIDQEVNDKSSPWKTAPFKDSVVHKPTGDNEVTCKKKKKNVENNEAKEGAVRCVYQILKMVDLSGETAILIEKIQIGSMLISLGIIKRAFETNP